MKFANLPATQKRLYGAQIADYKSAQVRQLSEDRAHVRGAMHLQRERILSTVSDVTFSSVSLCKLDASDMSLFRIFLFQLQNVYII